jgi:hypothetical protein
VLQQADVAKGTVLVFEAGSPGELPSDITCHYKSMTGFNERVRKVDCPAEPRGAWPEVVGKYSSGMVRAEKSLHSQLILAPDPCSDYDPANSRRDGDLQVRHDSVGPRRVDDNVDPAQQSDKVPPSARTTKDAHLVQAPRCRSLRGPTQLATTQDSELHAIPPGRGTSGAEDSKKAAATAQVSAALESPSPKAPSVVFCAPPQSLRTRASRQGRMGFIIHSVENWRRIGGSMTHRGPEAQSFLRPMESSVSTPEHPAIEGPRNGVSSPTGLTARQRALPCVRGCRQFGGPASAGLGP